MNNTKSFNNTNFESLLAWHIQNSNISIESVLNVLRQSSDNSRLAKLNHNCKISGIPFTWDYRSGDKEIRVLTFPMCKISTGWDFYLDIEESGYIYLSEGINTRRTYCKASILNSFAPSTMHAIADTIDLLCGADMNKEKIFFDIYRRFGGRGDLRYSKFDHETESLYNLYAFNSDYKYLEYMQKFESADAYEEIKKSNILKKIVVIKWEEDYDCWYADFLVDNSAWHIDCLNDVGSYPIKEDLTYDGDENLPKYAQDWLIEAVKSVRYRSGAKSGSWFCYESPVALKFESTRLWSEIPEDMRVNLFVSTDKDCRYFYNDITEINLSPDLKCSRVDFIWSHESCESPDNGCIENEDLNELERALNMTDESEEDED